MHAHDSVDARASAHPHARTMRPATRRNRGLCIFLARARERERERESGQFARLSYLCARAASRRFHVCVDVPHYASVKQKGLNYSER